MGQQGIFPNNIYLSNYYVTHREKPIIHMYDRQVVLCTVKTSMEYRSKPETNACNATCYYFVMCFRYIIQRVLSGKHDVLAHDSCARLPFGMLIKAPIDDLHMHQSSTHTTDQVISSQ
jgi:hypothetical protein